MFVLTESTKAKLQKTDDKALKLGQKDHRPAVILNLSVTLPNSALGMFDTALRAVLYGKGDPGEPQKKQAKLEGMDMVTDLPSLTKTGESLGSLNWNGEQTGSTLTIDYGTGGEKANLTLKDGTVNAFRIQLYDGGAMKVGFRFHAPVDHLSESQVGRLHLMHQRDVMIQLNGPSVEQQQSLDAGADEDDGADIASSGEPDTPLKAAQRAHGAKSTPAANQPKARAKK